MLLSRSGKRRIWILVQDQHKNCEHIDQANEPIYSEAVFVSERQKVLGLRRCDNDFANGVFGETAKTNLQNPDKEMGISLQPSRIGQIKGNFWCPIDACIWTSFGITRGYIPD